jgi:microfibrillar-associated protein 1
MQSPEREDEAADDVGVFDKEEGGGGEFSIRRKRKKTEAVVLLRKGDAPEEKKRHDSSESESESSSDESSTRHRNRRGRRSRSSSSSASEDSADRRRRRLRERSKTAVTQQRSVGDAEAGPRKHHLEESDDSLTSGEKKSLEPMKSAENILPTKKKQHGRGRSRSRSPSSDSSSSSSSDDSSTSSSSSSDSSQSDQPLPITVSKPLFVPKSKRGTIAALEAQQQKLEDVEERKLKEKEKRTLQSRALVAEAVSTSEKNNLSSSAVGDEDEFDGQSIPDDEDPTSPELAQAERDAWEVRELIRILREIDKAAEEEFERAELERRRNMKDEDFKDESYRAPGEARRKNDGSKYLQRYHHRGAFYMDDDTLEQAGEDDVRHRAAEYSRAATGEDKIDKAALPEVMQVKKFGFAGYSTKVRLFPLYLSCILVQF